MQIKNLFYDDTMDCYRPNSGDVYSAELPDMLISDMDIDLFQQQEQAKEPMSYQSAMSSAHMVLDNYSTGSQDSFIASGSPDTYSNNSLDNYGNPPQSYPIVNHQMQEYVQQFSPSTLPPKVPIMSSNSTSLDWLHPMSNGLQQSIATNPGAMMDTSISIANNDQSVHNQSLTAKMLSLPNSVQISGGNINYVNMPSVTQQVYVSSTTSSVGSQQSLPDCTDNGYRSRSNSSSSYVLSPSSAPASAVAENPFPKPPYSYSCLIALSLKNSQHGSLPVAEIYSFMMRHFPYFKTAPDGWKNSVRHNLSLNKCFEKIENPNADGTNSRKGCLWALNPAKIKKMDDEIFKWNKKDPLSIKRAMAHPEVLEVLSKGQEPLSLRNGMKRNHNRQMPLCTPLQHQPIHQQMHHQQPSPNHSPKMRVLDNTGLSSLTSNGTTNGMPFPISVAQHIHCSPPQPHMKHTVNSNEGSTDLFSLDSSLSEISIQNGLFDDLPAELLEYHYTYSPTAFLLSPKKATPPASPTVQHATELAVQQTNVPRGTLISLGQN